MTAIPVSQPNRRMILKAGAGAALVAVVPVNLHAGPADMQAAIRGLFGERPIEDGRVFLDIPAIAENGYSVPLTVSIDSPMTAADYVESVAVFSPRNPLPDIVRFHLGPRAGRAEISTRIRLGGTQTLTVIAEMSDGSLWSGSAEILVTLAACVVL